MKVLLVASEVSPIVKLGGLGDVIGALPKALQEIGVNIDVIVPFYPSVKTENLNMYKSLDLNVPFGGAVYPVGVFRTKLVGSDVDAFLLQNSHFFAKGGKDAFANNIGETEMFIFFNRAVVEFVKSQFNTYDLIHCNDWHTGLITHLLKDEIGDTRPATLFTIHNILYQGVGDSSLVESAGLVPGMHPLIDWDTEDGDINMMLQGITSSDYINTVSLTYAKELLTEEFGGGFSDILQSRRSRLVGILNGIDYSVCPRNYDVHDAVEGKLQAKAKLYEKIGSNKTDSHLSSDFSVENNHGVKSSRGVENNHSMEKPIFSFIGRMDVGQKGLGLLYDLIEQTPQNQADFVVLGVGDPEWEEKFKKLDRPNVSVNIIFDVDLANLIYAGSDFLLVPSKYEPCGLIQMMAMRYGTIPVVRRVGGLKDSVKNGITGLIFDEYDLTSFKQAFDKAARLYNDKDRLKTMIKNAMSEDFSWRKPAQQYKKLYEKIIKMRGLEKALQQSS